MTRNSLEYSKEYYKKNKDRIAKMMTTKVHCDCGCIVSKCNMNKHKKTEKHKRCLQSPASPTEEIKKLKEELSKLKSELQPVYILRVQ